MSGTEHLLTEELHRTSQAANSAQTLLGTAKNARLLAVGDISDMRDARQVNPHRVLAVAAGESGEILRLISLDEERWGWESEQDVTVTLYRPNDRLMGEWCEDSVPISLIKFFADHRRSDPTRWLIVQKASSTTVCEPELRILPAQKVGQRATSTPIQLFANPLFSITHEQTGGSPHSDFSLNPATEGEVPQIAIIDQSGCWTVWDITGPRSKRPKKLKPVLAMCGNMTTGSLPLLPSPKPTEDHEPHRILWLTLNRERGPLGDQDSFDHPDDGLPRSRILLMCNSTALYLYDVETRRLVSAAHLASSLISQPIGVPRIMDVAPSTLGPSQAFVLTNTTIFWIAAREGRRGKLSIELIASCPHRTDNGDPALKLEVSPAANAGANGAKTCFVCIRSSKDTQLTFFWFTSAGEDTPTGYQTQTVRLDAPNNFIGLSVLPVTRMGPATTARRIRFFQLLTLGYDLDVGCALCAWSRRSYIHQDVQPPDQYVGRLSESSKRKWRRKLLRLLGPAFVVPDEYDGQDDLFEEDDYEEELLRFEERSAREFDVTWFGRHGVANICRTSEQPGGDIDLDVIKEAIGQETRADGVMPRRSLLDLAGWEVLSERLYELASDWMLRQQELLDESDGKVIVQEPVPRLSNGNADLFLEYLRNMCSGLPISEEGDMLHNLISSLRLIASQVFLSEVGISVIPQEWADAEAAKAAEALMMKQESLTETFASSMNIRSSPPIMSSQTAMSSQLGPESQETSTQRSVVAESGEEKVSMRLRRYAEMDPIPAEGVNITRLAVNWEIGSDPDYVKYKIGEDPNIEDQASRRRRKIEAKRRRSEKLAAKVLSGTQTSGRDDTQSSFGGGFPATQPPQILSSQIIPKSSQIVPKSSQIVPVLPSQSMSQVVPGPFGGRPPQRKKAKPKKSGFR